MNIKDLIKTFKAEEHKCLPKSKMCIHQRYIQIYNNFFLHILAVTLFYIRHLPNLDPSNVLLLVNIYFLAETEMTKSFELLFPPLVLRYGLMLKFA